MLLFSLLSLASATAAQTAKKKSAPAKADQSLTGCVDQRGERFVLRDGKTTKVMAHLEGVGFSNDNFAQHLGHRVTVHGKLESGEPAMMRVRRIELVADVCEP
jgi:hypothetical protein